MKQLTYFFLLLPIILFSQQLVVKGVVLDDIGDPLPGATIQIQGLNEVGAITNFDGEFSILLEYNSALNENDMTAETMSISKGGYLNAAVRWSFVESLHLELALNNLLFDDEKVEYFKREIKITYIEYF